MNSRAKTKSKAKRKPKKKPEKGFKWTPLRRLFVLEYLVDLNAKEAAIRAGYSAHTAKQIGSELRQIPEIKEAIEKKISKRAERIEITTDMVLQEQAKIAFHDPRKFFNPDGTLKAIVDLDDHTAACVAGFEIDEVKKTDKNGTNIIATTMKKLKIADKRAGLVDLGKHLGMNIDRLETGEPGEFEDLTDEQLLRDIQDGISPEETFSIEEPPSGKTV